MPFLKLAKFASLGGKWIEVKSATVNGQPAPGQKCGTANPEIDTNKIFVGGLPMGCTESQVTQYFQQFGALTSVMLKVDDQGKARGFGFVEFADDASVDEISHKIFKICSKIVQFVLKIAKFCEN